VVGDLDPALWKFLTFLVIHYLLSVVSLPIGPCGEHFPVNSRVIPDCGLTWYRPGGYSSPWLLSASLTDHEGDGIMLAGKLDKLRSLMPELYRVTDEATDAIESAEEMLKGIGLRVSVPTDMPGKSLAYRRVGRGNGSYRIVVEKEDQEFGEHATVEWEGLTRGEKLSAFLALPALLEEIGRKGDEMVKLMDRVQEMIPGWKAAEV
jgi:hypothetical protein